MSIEILLALSVFAFVSSITPGPNNVMLMSSGATFGFKRTLPHMFGVGLGFGLMVFLVGIGLAQIMSELDNGYQVLKIISIAYLLFLAFKIANSGPISQEDSDSQPITFLQAAIFQWVNPKAWTMALTATSVYATQYTIESIIIVTVVFVIVNIPAVSMWAIMGQQMQRLLTSQCRLMMFNRTMAALLVVSVVPMLFS